MRRTSRDEQCGRERGDEEEEREGEREIERERDLHKVIKGKFVRDWYQPGVDSLG